MAITSVVCNISMQFGFQIQFVVSANSIVTLPYKGQSGVTMAINVGTKMAINAYKCISTRDNENVITYNRGFAWSANPKKTFLFARV